MKYAKQAQPQQIASEELTLSFGTFPLAHKHLSTLGSGSWVKRLGWIFGRPWRTAITVGFLDILAVTFGLLFGYIVGKKILHAGAAFEVYLPLWICFCTFLVLIYYLKGGYER